MRSGTSLCNIIIPPFSRRTTPQHICLTLRPHTAAWNHRPPWCEPPVGWVARSILDGRNSILRNRLRSIAPRKWDFYVGGWSCYNESFKIGSVLSPAQKGPPYMINTDKPIKPIAIWDGDMRRLCWRRSRRGIRRSSQWSTSNGSWRDYQLQNRKLFRQLNMFSQKRYTPSTRS